MLMDLYDFGTLIVKKWFLECCLSVWVYTSSAHEWLEGVYLYLVFKSLPFLGQCPVNLNIPAPKSGTLQIGPKMQNGDFLENGSNDFENISVIYGDHIPK
jgi:hypothetical protein